MQEFTAKLKNMDNMLGFSPKNLDVVPKYLWDIQIHLQNKVMIFNPSTIDKACVQAQYLENICHEKG